jgi:dTDP-glucose pyrophosphorylase/CBS domain-containing protein
VKRAEQRELPLVPERGTLIDVLRVLERGAVRAALVSSDEGRLVGILTDGDVRRALLAGCSLDAPLRPYVNREFTSVRANAARDEVLELMQAREIDQIPILDAEGRPCGLHLLREIVGAERRPNWAVVMAGGRGSRLGSLTADTPKPMLRVAGRPILERIILRLVGHGIHRIYISVHYLSHVVEDHFADGSRFGCKIDYLREDQPLGTGGALSLLPDPVDPVLVMNGDLVTQADVGGMLDFHARGGQALTIGVRRYLHTIPFGCVQLDGDRVTAFDEKPTLTCQMNAGIYVLSPASVKRVPKNQEFPLPNLLLDSISRREPVAAFEVEGDWIDVGQRDHLRQARGETA